MAKAQSLRVTYASGEKVIRGSGNIYADLGLPNADDVLARARLLETIQGIVTERKLTQTDVARRTGVKQPKISVLLGGDTRGFTAERLMRMLNALGQDVEIRIHPAPSNRSGRTLVRALTK